MLGKRGECILCKKSRYLNALGVCPECMAVDVTYCNSCKCMTHSIRRSKLVFVCGK